MTTNNWTNEQVLDDWLTYMEAARGRTSRTIEAYRAALMRLVEFLNGKPLVNADAAELEVFCGLWLHKKGVVARSRKPYISAVKGFYAWLKAKGITHGNASDELVHPVTHQPLPRMISLANAEKLMWAPDMSTFVGIRDASILALLVGCGLRVSGVTGLNESSLITMEIECVQRLAIKVLEKGNRERIMPVPRDAEALLRVYMGHEDLAAIDRAFMNKGRLDKVLFVSMRSPLLAPHEHIGDKRRLTRKAINEIILRHGKRTGIPIDQLHPHAFRHLFGTELTEDDVPTRGVQELLGHSDIKSTTVYTHLAMRKKMQTVDKSGPLSKMRTPVSELLKRLPS